MREKYIKNFDGLRGLAVLAVLAFHGSYGYFRGGFLGVDLFFIVSGYLITSLLFEEYQVTGKISFGKFYARRALRLVPPLVIGIVIANLLWPVTKMDSSNDQVVATLAAVFYSTNLINDTVTGNMSHFWSLSIEEHFYFIWPFVMALVISVMRPDARIRLLVVVILGITLFRIISFMYQDKLMFGIFWIDPYGFTLCRIDCILLGALLYFFLSTRTDFNAFDTRRNYIWLLGCLLVFFVFGLTLSLYDALWRAGGFIITNLFCLAIVFLSLRTPDSPVLSNKILVWIGKRSYGIYVYHFPIFLALEGLRVPHSLPNFIVVTMLRFGISVAVAELSYRLIEKPILNFKRHYQISTELKPKMH